MPEGSIDIDMNTTVEEPHTSQNFQYCVDVYKLMVEEARELTEEQTGSVAMTVWQGFFTKLIVERLALSVPYYSTIRRELMRMGCIRQLRRGGGSSPSQWELLRAPTLELWHHAPAKHTYNQSMQQASLRQVADLSKRLTRLEENFTVLAQAFANSGNKVEIPFDEPERPEEAGDKVYEVVKE